MARQRTGLATQQTARRGIDRALAVAFQGLPRTPRAAIGNQHNLSLRPTNLGQHTVPSRVFPACFYCHGPRCNAPMKGGSADTCLTSARMLDAPVLARMLPICVRTVAIATPCCSAISSGCAPRHRPCKTRVSAGLSPFERA